MSGGKIAATVFIVLLFLGGIIALVLYFTNVTCPDFGYQCETDDIYTPSPITDYTFTPSPITTTPSPSPITTTPSPSPITTTPSPSPITTTPSPSPITTTPSPTGGPLETTSPGYTCPTSSVDCNRQVLFDRAKTWFNTTQNDRVYYTINNITSGVSTGCQTLTNPQAHCCNLTYTIAPTAYGTSLGYTATTMSRPFYFTLGTACNPNIYA